MTIEQQLTALVAQKDRLVHVLVSKGISASRSEKFNTLIDKVEHIVVPQVKNLKGGSVEIKNTSGSNNVSGTLEVNGLDASKPAYITGTIVIKMDSSNSYGTTYTLNDLKVDGTYTFTDTLPGGIEQGEAGYSITVQNNSLYFKVIREVFEPASIPVPGTPVIPVPSTKTDTVTLSNQYQNTDYSIMPLKYGEAIDTVTISITGIYQVL